ncbi:glycosyltransferase family 4 protein [Flavobacterium enshiense]|uniref:glycosyltransferase family 4 protein n=1 Tax=Flavobacterium enshiense TaxID=1341165 RepID=UPI00345DCE16
MKKLIRVTTIPLSLEKLLENQLRFMNSHYEVIAVSSEKERLQRFGEDQQIRTFSIGMTRKITPFKDLLSLWEMYVFLKKEKPFIVHTHTPKAGIVGMLAARLAGVPNRLHTVAGLPLLEARGLKRSLLNSIEKLTYGSATKVYPNSLGLRQIIESLDFCQPEKLHVIGNGSSNGIDTRYFDPALFSEEEKSKTRAELGISENNFVYVFIGRLVTDKGINELVEAFFRLHNSNSKLLLVGPLETDLDPLHETTLEEIARNPNIVTTGYQTDVRRYLSVSDVLVFPSYREGFPNVVMQAGAMGLPSIVSNINGCNEIIVPGANGIIIPVKDTEALFEAMKQIQEDDALRNTVKTNARMMIKERFEQHVVWEALLTEYKQLENNV